MSKKITINQYATDWIEAAGDDLRGITVEEIYQDLIATMGAIGCDKHDFALSYESAKIIKKLIDGHFKENFK